MGLHLTRKAWEATKEILDLTSDCNLRPLSVGTIQELFSFFVTLRRDFIARAEVSYDPLPLESGSRVYVALRSCRL